MTGEADCPFCKRIRGRKFLLATRHTAVAITDAHPVNPGHCLVLPKRHEPDFFELTLGEQGEIELSLLASTPRTPGAKVRQRRRTSAFRMHSSHARSQSSRASRR